MFRSKPSFEGEELGVVWPHVQILGLSKSKFWLRYQSKVESTAIDPGVSVKHHVIRMTGSAPQAGWRAAQRRFVCRTFPIKKFQPVVPCDVRGPRRRRPHFGRPLQAGVASSPGWRGPADAHAIRVTLARVTMSSLSASVPSAVPDLAHRLSLIHI